MPSDEDRRLALKALSILLRYPEEGWIRALPGIDSALAPFREASFAAPMRRFLSWAGGMPALRLQESYTAAFDLNPATCLDLTYHTQGDTENRGRVLARLRGAYRSAGCACTTDELPDHLPLVLEFLSFAEDDVHEILELCAPAAQDLAGKLRAADSPYAALVESAAAILTTMAADAGKEVVT
jgi:nitrate reductase delta subunit